MGIADYGKTASTYVKPTGLYAAVVTRVDGNDVYLEVPNLTVDFEHGPVAYVGSVPAVGRDVFVGFLNGDPDTVVGIFPPSNVDLSGFLELIGGTMSGDIGMAGNDIDMAGGTLDNVNAIKPDDDLMIYKADGSTLSFLWDESTDRWQMSAQLEMDSNEITGLTFVQPPVNEPLQIKDEQGVVRIQVEDSDVEGGDIVFYKADGGEAFRLTQTTGTLTMSGPISGPTDPTLGTHVGDRDYNDARYSTSPTPLIFSSGDIELEVKTGTGRFKTPYAFTLVSATATCGVAPTGADVIVDINKNDVTMFSSKPTITAGNQDSSVQTPSVTAVAIGDVITVDIDQIGSTLAGENLTVILDIEVP